MSQPRRYRSFIRNDHLVAFRVSVKETDLHVQADQVLEAYARDLVLTCRHHIESYISRQPHFATSLDPVEIDVAAPQIVRTMARAAFQTGVGPMAAVAGAISQFVGEGLLQRSEEVVVENGGDVFIRIAQPATIAIYAGKSPLSMKVGLRVPPKSASRAVCTSSGTIGHSLSFGSADAVCVLAEDCALADAAATAIANRIHTRTDISAAIEFAKRIGGLTGIVAVKSDRIGFWGEIEVIPLGGKKG